MNTLKILWHLDNDQGYEIVEPNWKQLLKDFVAKFHKK